MNFTRHQFDKGVITVKEVSALRVKRQGSSTISSTLRNSTGWLSAWSAM